jgi:predicted NAD/FAD-binding protein
VSGLTAAYLLRDTHHVTLYEAEPRLGGHAHTHDVATAGGSSVPVDSGFIVLNDRTYPLLRHLFAELGVETRPTEMSMSITCGGCGLGYVGGRGPRGIFAQPRRAVDSRFWRLLAQVARFQRRAKALLAAIEDHPGGGHPDESLTYGDFLRQERLDAYFVAHYALPVVSCVWSMGQDEALDYPAAYLFAFLRHHGFLDLGDAPTWHTVVGGSRAYVGAIAERLDVVRPGVAVTGIARTAEGVLVRSSEGAAEEVAEFDQAVLATHADDALRLLDDPTHHEQHLLGTFGYSTNETYLHRDATFLPEPRVRASWNYRLEDCGHHVDRTRVSYWMNRLQGHDERDPLVVTLNPHEAPDQVVARMSYRHPVYTTESVTAQRELPGLNDGRIAFAGAYQGWGFHEDGCASGARAALSLGGRDLTVDVRPDALELEVAG